MAKVGKDRHREHRFDGAHDEGVGAYHGRDGRAQPIGGVLRHAVHCVQQGLDAQLDAVKEGCRHEAAVGGHARGHKTAAGTQI